MKQLNLFFILLITSFAFSQELVTNGDFETGDGTGWTGNAVNVVTENGNSYNSANVAAAGNPWDANISSVLSITTGVTYRLQFDAWSDQGRTIVAGIGLNEDPWTNVIETFTLTTTSQSFDMNFVANATSTNSRVFFDMGADVGFVGIDNVSLTVVEVTPTCSDGIQNGNETGVDCGGPDCSPCAITGPQSPAPTPPARAATDVVSVFSDAYTDIAVNEWGPNWGPSSSRIEDAVAGTDPIKQMDVNAGQTFAGIDFSGAKFDATSFTHFHMDYWIDSPLNAGQALSIKLSNHDESVGAGETSAIQTLPVPVAGEWVSLDIPLDDFIAASAPANLDRNGIAQIVMTAARADGNEPVDIYLDNIYFHKNTVLGVDDINQSQENFTLYPNPVRKGEAINLSVKGSNVEMYNTGGQLVKSAQDTETIGTAGLESGIYIIRVQTENGNILNNKVVVK